MWEVPHFRIRAYLQHMRRRREKRLARYQAPLHFRRVAAELRVTDGVALPLRPVQARLVLNELGPTGATLWSSQPFHPGQLVSFTLQEPRIFFVRARVVGCRRQLEHGRVFSPMRFDHRIWLEFVFESLAEREAVEEYWVDIRRGLKQG